MTITGTFNAGEYARRYWLKAGKHSTPLQIPEDPALAAEQQARFLGYIRKFAPHWEQELTDIDRALALPPGTSLQKLCWDPKPNPLPPHECTSWIVTPEIHGHQVMQLHKNRDAGERKLDVKQIAAPGKIPWIGMGNQETFSPTMGMNTAGLVVAMNSGDLTEEFQDCGFTTPDLARILLEECSSAEAAAALLQTMLRAGAYRHGNRGSIWFFADSRQALIAEHNALHFACHPVTCGIGLRANFWQYPEMHPYSRETPLQRLRQRSRENAAYKILLDESLLTHQKITPADHFRAARSCAVYGDSRALCSQTTNSAALFTVDCEYPGLLSTVRLAAGPPRRTVFLPVPLAAGVLPEALLNGTFSDRIFETAEEFNGNLHTPAQVAPADVSIAPWEALEKELEKRHTAAVEKARTLLKNNGSPEEAAGILQKAFEKNWQAVARRFLA